MELNITPATNKEAVFESVREKLEAQNFTIIDSDNSRPWGGFFVIDEKQSSFFIDTFLSNIPEAKTQQFGKISPKILIVAPRKRLSWQYHHRRSEVWKVIYGEAGVVISDTDEEKGVCIKKQNDVIILKKGERHRLIGTEGWGVIAEIWQHTDAENPSNEDDIVRVQDDFGR